MDGTRHKKYSKWGNPDPEGNHGMYSFIRGY